jgi:DNA mismatch endonuclease, patch repair protein
MADIFSKEKRSEVMSKITSKNTKPEIVVRKYIFSLGFRYRLHKKDLPGSPDIVLSKYKTLIFVHGCFWHGHPCKIGSGLRKPKSNRNYWNQKINKNIDRDKKNIKQLKKMDWNVIIIWECETKKLQFLKKKLKPLLILKNA